MIGKVSVITLCFFCRKARFSAWVLLWKVCFYTPTFWGGVTSSQKKEFFIRNLTRWQNSTITSTLNYDTRRQHRHKSQITASLVISASCSFHLSNSRDSLQGIVTKANYMSFHTLKLRQQMSIDWKTSLLREDTQNVKFYYYVGSDTK